MYKESDYGIYCSNAVSSAQTAREFKFYEYAFYDGDVGLKLRGKTILDLGAGGSDFVSKVPLVGGMGVAFDYNFPPYSIGRARNVRGLAQSLPFKDDTFDEVLASYSLFWIGDGLIETLKEMLRVTKPGGKIKIFPALRSPGVNETAPIPFQGEVIYSKEAEGPRLQLLKPENLAFNELYFGVLDIAASFTFTLPFYGGQSRQYTSSHPKKLIFQPAGLNNTIELNYPQKSNNKNFR